MSERGAALDEIGRRFGTDKSSMGHDYLAFYARFFEKIRYQPLKLLEIGVYEGASLRVWSEYFPNATIIGADIDPSVPRFRERRVSVEIVDQANIEDLVGLGVRHGPFDLVIDDGSHRWDHQITSLRTLFPFVRNGGFYVVEDLQSNFGPAGERYRGASSISCVEYLKKLVDLRVANAPAALMQEEDAFLRTYGHALHLIVFYRECCLIEKRYARDAAPSFEPDAAVDLDSSVVPLLLTAHIGNRGDRRSDTGWISGGATDQNIQGFQIDCLHGAKGDIGYRARLSDGSWTGWAQAGEFVGTRGSFQDLTGFAVRLGEAWRGGFDLDVSASFRGEADAVAVRGGEDCVSRSGSGPLAGMQVVLRARATR